MPKYSKEIIKECSEWVAKNGLIEYGGAKLKDFCSYFRIDSQTYYNWLGKSEFSDIIKKAKDEYKNNLKKEVVDSLSKAAKGYTYDKEKKKEEYLPSPEDGKLELSKLTKETETVNVAPNVGAAIFLLTNIAPDEWSNTQRNDITIKKEDENEMSLEDIKNEIERLNKVTTED